MSIDTQPGTLGDGKTRQIIKFDPTVSTGTLLQMAMIAAAAIGGYATYTADKATTRFELDQVKQAANADRLATKESLMEMKGDIKEIQRTMTQVDRTLATIEAKQPRVRP